MLLHLSVLFLELAHLFEEHRQEFIDDDSGSGYYAESDALGNLKPLPLGTDIGLVSIGRELCKVVAYNRPREEKTSLFLTVAGHEADGLGLLKFIMVFEIIFVGFLLRYWLIWASYWIRYAPIHLDCNTCKEDCQNGIDNYEEQRDYLRYRRP